MIRKTLFFLLLSVPAWAFSQGTVSADSAAHYLQKGLDEKQAGRRLVSLQHFEKAHSYNPADKIILGELATAYNELRRYKQAMDTYKKLLDAGDTSAETYRQLMLLSFNFRSFDDVVVYADQLKKADPSQKVSYYVGTAYYQQENYGKALKHLDAAAKEDPANAEIPYMIARSYSDMTNFKQSIPYYQKAIELDTTKNFWMYELGLIYYNLNDSKNSLKYILMAGEKGYRKDNTYIENLAIAYLNAGQADKAISMLREILDRKPSDINILNMLAETYYSAKKYQEAMDYWDQILGYDKENAKALYMIGMCYQKKGEKEKGMHLCDRAIEMDPSLGSLRQKNMMMGL